MMIDLIINLRYQLSKNLRNKETKEVKEIYFLLDKLEKSINKLIKN